MAEYLDYTGLTYFKNKLDQQNNNKYVAKGIKINGVALNSSDITIHAVDSTARIPASEKGIANGVATLDSTGKVPSSQLPSYVDDVKEYENLANFPATGETDKLYLAIDTGNIYRWSGSQYVQINNSVSTAESAVKDGDGNTITTTYATKTELSTKVPASVGSATKPVYTNSSGVITACTYELNKTVPSNAVFTDTKVTNTKGNTTKFYLTGTNSASTNTGTQYFDSTIYTTTTEGELVAKNFTGLASKATADASGNTITTTYATKAENNEKLDADSANYIKSLSISGKTITYTKGDSTTGTLTTQDTTYGAGTAALLTAGTDTANRVWTAKILHDALPVTMTAATASAAGKGGLVPAPAAGKQTSFLRGDGTWVVPTDTNTHYTTHLYVGSGTAANAATTNGNTKLALYDDSTSRSTITIKGTGATGVTSDANGVITINSTAYSAMTATELNTGTATTSRLITAKVLSDFVEGATSSITTEQIDALFV